MSLKLVIFSVDGTICRNGQIDNGLLADITTLISRLQQHGVSCALWSNRSWMVGGTTPLATFVSQQCYSAINLHGLANDGMPNRTSQNSAAPLLAQYGASRYEAVFVGSTDNDVRAGVNNNLLLVRPDWYGKQVEYGFPISSVSELARFLFVFAMRQHPIFWQLRTASGVDVSSAGPFSTKRPDYAVFGGDARAFAKAGSGHPEFWFQFTVSSLYFSGLLEGVNYLTTYPGHDPNSAPNGEMTDNLIKLGQCFNKSYYRDLLLRHQLAPKSQYTPAAARKYAPQLATVTLNWHPTRNQNLAPNKSRLSLRDKKILMIDDFCTSGRSIETARCFIECAGGTLRAYSWLKTINVAYEEMDPLIQVQPYKANAGIPEPISKSHAYAASIIDGQAPSEIQQIFDNYRTWTWP